MEKLISIIIPIYNVEKYLAQCLDSAINQTHTNLEIICINDGSTDNCKKILKDYEKKDDRIVVYNNKNEGVGAARNYGVQKSKGEYIYFIDSDDYISPNYIEGLYQAITCDTDIDLAYNERCVNVHINKQTNMTPKLKWKSGVYSDINKFFNLSSTSICNKLIRKDFLINNDIKFEKNLRFEDRLLHSKMMFAAKKIAISRTGKYYYRRFGTSFSNTYYSSDSEKTKFDEIEIYKKIYSLYKECNQLENMLSIKWLMKHYDRTAVINKENMYNGLKGLFKTFDEDFLSSRNKKELMFYEAILNRSFEDSLIITNKLNSRKKILKNILHIIRGTN